LVLDASALLAYVLDEQGASEVEEQLANRAVISAANLAEVLSKLSERGKEPREAVTELEQQGLLGGLIDVESFTLDDAVASAELHVPTRDRGLSLGDRACLALGRRLAVPVMTADRLWVEIEGDVGVEVHTIRS
jgi:ribonuclease VapC